MIRSARRLHFFCALLSLLALLPAPAFAQNAVPKLGYVDVKRLLDNAPQMAESRSKLEREFAARDVALKADETRLVSLRQRQEAASPSDVDTIKREVDALERNIKRTREDLRGELNSRAGAERDRVWQKINNSVIEYAREQGYDVILPSPVIYASSRIDITEQVLERLKREAQSDANRAKSNLP